MKSAILFHYFYVSDSAAPVGAACAADLPTGDAQRPLLRLLPSATPRKGCGRSRWPRRLTDFLCLVLCMRASLICCSQYHLMAKMAYLFTSFVPPRALSGKERGVIRQAALVGQERVKLLHVVNGLRELRQRVKQRYHVVALQPDQRRAVGRGVGEQNLHGGAQAVHLELAPQPARRALHAVHDARNVAEVRSELVLGSGGGLLGWG